LLDEKLRAKLPKLERSATHKLLISYIHDQVENVLSDLDGALHDDPIIKIMLLTLVREDSIKGFNKVMS
jgi:hypothetical protein